MNTNTITSTPVQALDLAKAYWQTGHVLRQESATLWTVRTAVESRLVGVIEYHDDAAAWAVTKLTKLTRTERVERVLIAAD